MHRKGAAGKNIYPPPEVQAIDAKARKVTGVSWPIGYAPFDTYYAESGGRHTRGGPGNADPGRVPRGERAMDPIEAELAEQDRTSHDATHRHGGFRG